MVTSASPAMWVWRVLFSLLAAPMLVLPELRLQNKLVPRRSGCPSSRTIESDLPATTTSRQRRIIQQAKNRKCGIGAVQASRPARKGVSCRCFVDLWRRQTIHGMKREPSGSGVTRRPAKRSMRSDMGSGLGALASKLHEAVGKALHASATGGTYLP